MVRFDMGTWEIIGLAASSGAAVAVSAIVFFRRRLPPEEVERRRCRAVNTHGRMVDASVVDVEDRVVQYTYHVRGVTYTASQDLKCFSSAPVDPAMLLGVATVKYLPADPASSIVFCESWSGLRQWAPTAPEVDSIQKES